MIILQSTTDAQTFNTLLNVDKSSLPLNNITFELRDPVEDSTESAQGTLVADGFTQDATVAFVGLQEGAKYELEVKTLHPESLAAQAVIDTFFNNIASEDTLEMQVVNPPFNAIDQGEVAFTTENNVDGTFAGTIGPNDDFSTGVGFAIDLPLDDFWTDVESGDIVMFFGDNDNWSFFTVNQENAGAFFHRYSSSSVVARGIFPNEVTVYKVTEEMMNNWINNIDHDPILETIGKEVVFVTSQTLESYSISNGQFVYFSDADTIQKHVIF